MSETIPCLPNCCAQHAAADGCFYCQTPAIVVPAARDHVEVWTDRTIGDGPDDVVTTPWRVCVATSGELAALTPAAACMLGWSLIAESNRITEALRHARDTVCRVSAPADALPA
jgi:hypothetical protein